MLGPFPVSVKVWATICDPTVSIQFLNFGEYIYCSFKKIEKFANLYIKGNTTFKENYYF